VRLASDLIIYLGEIAEGGNQTPTGSKPSKIRRGK